ncbi:MAG TPA: hypothetical protein VFV87_20260, partial [Pirellulaceae bacterium]|nr:hypothetical protein [Pirellulaceae bacterium]
SRLEAIEREYAAAVGGRSEESGVGSQKPSSDDVRRIISDLDDQGRWISTYAGERLVGQPKFKLGYQYLDSGVFSRNLNAISAFLEKE